MCPSVCSQCVYLSNTGTVSLVGQEVEVFRCYTRPWFSAVVTDHNLATGELTIMDSNVLMPYTLERNKVQIRLPQGVKGEEGVGRGGCEGKGVLYVIYRSCLC